MIESWQVPILTSALDFLFDVGRFLLADIRSRREQGTGTLSKKSEGAQPSSPQVTGFPTVQSSKDSLMVDTIWTKQEALRSVIQESALQQREAEIQHLLGLAEIYRQNHRLASEKYAKWGDTLVPSVVVHELMDSEQHLIETLAKLKANIEEVLGKKIESDEFLILQDT